MLVKAVSTVITNDLRDKIGMLPDPDALGKEIEETRIKSEKLIDTLRSVIEETAIRLTDLKKDAYEFKRDIVVGAENFRGH